jgi:creatinine amidohydrolase
VSEVKLDEMSWQDAKEYFSRSDIVILPVGSVEQHGPQNPLGTDYMIAYRLAAEASRRTGVAVLPPVPFGVSEHHSRFPGTVWVSEESLRSYVLDVIRALAAHGVRKVVVVNGHGGNLNALRSAAMAARREGVLVVIYQWWTLPELRSIFSEEELGHAASVETSVNLYLHPHLVRMDRAVDEKPARLPTDGLGYYPERTDDRVRSGVFGVSTTASKDKGEKAFQTALEALVKLVEAVKSLEPRP